MAKKKVKRRAISHSGPERKHTTMRLDVELMKDLKKIATRQNRSVSNLVEAALTEFARRVIPAPAAAGPAGGLFD